MDEYWETLRSDQAVIFYKAVKDNDNDGLSHKIWVTTASMPVKEAKWCLEGILLHTSAFLITVDKLLEIPEVKLIKGG